MIESSVNDKQFQAAVAALVESKIRAEWSRFRLSRSTSLSVRQIDRGMHEMILTGNWHMPGEPSVSVRDVYCDNGNGPEMWDVLSHMEGRLESVRDKTQVLAGYVGRDIESRPVNTDIVAAAKELRDHAWLSRFRRAEPKNTFNEMSHCACNDIAAYIDKFLDLVLASESKQ